MWSPCHGCGSTNSNLSSRYVTDWHMHLTCNPSPHQTHSFPQFQAQFRQQRTTRLAMGCLLESSLNIVVAARALTPHVKNLMQKSTPLLTYRFCYAMCVVAIWVPVRGAPYALWVWNRPSLTRWYIPVCVATRLLSVFVFALHQIVFVNVGRTLWGGVGM